MRYPQEFQPLDSAVTPRFAEPATFMRTPYVPGSAGLDIALVGVPFDLGSTNRAGARHGRFCRKVGFWRPNPKIVL